MCLKHIWTCLAASSPPPCGTLERPVPEPHMDMASRWCHQMESHPTKSTRQNSLDSHHKQLWKEANTFLLRFSSAGAIMTKNSVNKKCQKSYNFISHIIYHKSIKFLCSYHRLKNAVRDSLSQPLMVTWAKALAHWSQRRPMTPGRQRHWPVTGSQAPP